MKQKSTPSCLVKGGLPFLLTSDLTPQKNGQASPKCVPAQRVTHTYMHMTQAYFIHKKYWPMDTPTMGCMMKESRHVRVSGRRHSFSALCLLTTSYRSSSSHPSTTEQTIGFAHSWGAALAGHLILWSIITTSTRRRGCGMPGQNSAMR